VNLLFVTRSDVASIEALEGKPSHDDEPEKVARFCADWSLPYSREFRSIFIYYKGEAFDPAGASIKAYGNPFLLNEETVLAELEIACSQDIHNAAVNGIDTPQLAERNSKRFEDLSAIPADDLEARREALLRALARRERGQYVEARIFRALTKADIARKFF